MARMKRDNLSKVCFYIDVEAVKAAKVAAIKKGIDPDIAGNSSALIRHLVSEFCKGDIPEKCDTLEDILNREG